MRRRESEREQERVKVGEQKDESGSVAKEKKRKTRKKRKRKKKNHTFFRFALSVAGISLAPLGRDVPGACRGSFRGVVPLPSNSRLFGRKRFHAELLT